jgi:uncharacterized protein
LIFGKILTLPMTSHITTPAQPTLAQIVIYPIKSLDGKIVNSAKISAGGALDFDRRWAIVDDLGKIVNAKRTAKIHRLRSQFDFGDAATEIENRLLITLQTADENTRHTFSIATELTALAQWLSEFFGFPVSLIENAVNGFPDDRSAYGPTIVSTATLETICTWFPDLDLAEVRRRFRTNLELSGVPAFWEDRLFAAPAEVVNFQLGNVRFSGINPCQRCPVPTRNSLTGENLPKFQQTFTQQRQQTLSSEVNLARFNNFARLTNFYRLSTNTQIPLSEAGKVLNTHDVFSI